MLKFSAAVAIFVLVVPSILAATINSGDNSTENDLNSVEDYKEISSKALISKCSLSYACFGNKHYYFESKNKLSRDDAAEFCSAINMSLISVEDCSKDTFVTNMIKNNDCYKRNYWTSGYRTTSNVWYWGNSNVFSYTNWKSAEPSLGRNKYCMVYRNSYVQWSDEVCGNKNYFICESNNACK